jgi:hypothetical protein
MDNVLGRPVEAEARLRPKNQMTIPDAIVRALHATPDDTFVFEADPEQPGVAQVHVIPHSFAGSMTGVYGTTEDVIRFVRDEHKAWGE